jgi:hypothetical protein
VQCSAVQCSALQDFPAAGPPTLTVAHGSDHRMFKPKQFPFQSPERRSTWNHGRAKTSPISYVPSAGRPHQPDRSLPFTSEAMDLFGGGGEAQAGADGTGQAVVAVQVLGAG